MSLPHALLGVLDASPMNGYSLARFFAGAQSWIWSAPQSQVYAALKKLETDGFIIGTQRSANNGATTTVWSLTPAGRAEFAGWVSTPHPSPPTRDATGLQALHLDSVPVATATAVLDAYITEQQTMVEEWSRHRDALARLDTPLLRERLKHRDPAQHSRIARLKAHAFDGQIEQARTRIAWARRGIELLTEGAPPVS